MAFAVCLQLLGVVSGVVRAETVADVDEGSHLVFVGEPGDALRVAASQDLAVTAAAIAETIVSSYGDTAVQYGRSSGQGCNASRAQRILGAVCQHR